MKNQSWKWAAAVAGTVVVAGVVWAQGPAPQEERRPGRGRLPWNDPKLKEELGLSDDHVAKLKAQASAQRKEGIRVRAQMQVAEVELEELMEAASPDEKAVAAKAKEIGDLRSKAYQSRVAGRLSFKKILTAEQQQRLRDVMGRRIEERRPEPGSRPPLPEGPRRFRERPRDMRERPDMNGMPDVSDELHEDVIGPVVVR